MPPKCMELWARRLKIKRGQRLTLGLFFLEDDCAAAACTSLKNGILDERGNSWHSLGLVWPGSGGQAYFSLGVLEGMESEAEACHSSEIVSLLYLMLF